MPTLTASEAITLRGGHIVSLEALQLLWQLENRGLNLEQEGDQLAVFPRSLLTDDDRAHIRQHRDELLQLVRYCETVQ